MSSFGFAPNQHTGDVDHSLIISCKLIKSGGNIAKIAAQYNCRLVYLPAYSPDMNPIEQRWFVLKNRIRVLRSQGIDFMSAIEQAFKEM